jgi:hypothetical protein
VLWRVPTPVSEKPHVMPSPTAWPCAVKSITSLPFSVPVRLAVTVTDPPHVADMFPATSVAVRFVICQLSCEQLEIFGSPFGVDDAQVPENAEVEDPDDELADELDEELEDELDEDEEDVFVFDGAVGSSTSVLL